MGGIWSGFKPAEVGKKGDTTTPIIEFPEATCDNYMFDTTGCNITVQGKLLLVLDSINSTLRNYFSCFCEVVQARLNNTNVTTEILAGGNQSSCNRPDSHSNVDEVLIQEKLKDLNLEYEPHDKYTGNAVLLTDRGFTFANFSALSKDQEPFVYVVNVGGNNESQNSSCRRQYRHVDDMTRISDIGLELESIACDPTRFFTNNNCTREIPSSSTPPLAVIQAASLPLVISSVVAALVMVVIIILFFATKCKRQAMCSKNTAMENSAINSGFGALDSSGKDPLSADDIYSKLRENEKRTNDYGNQENYHHLDLNFVKDEIEPSPYDHVTEIKSCDHYDFISPS